MWPLSSIGGGRYGLCGPVTKKNLFFAASLKRNLVKDWVQPLSFARISFFPQFFSTNPGQREREGGVENNNLIVEIISTECVSEIKT